MDHLFSRRVARMAARAATAFAAVAIHVSTTSSPASSVGIHSFEAESVPGEFVVELRDELRSSDLRTSFRTDFDSLSKSLGAKVVDRVRADMVVVRAQGAPSAKTLRRFLSRLRAHALVSRVEPNYIYRTSGRGSGHTSGAGATAVPNDPEFSKTWGLNNIGAVDESGKLGLRGVDIGAIPAWDITTGSKSVVVAVIDTGIDFAHPDLNGQAWTNEKERNGQPGVDDDGNGLIDDVHGYDFVGNKGDATDDNGHGTHCAGTIGAKGGDGVGIVGVNWNVSLMAVKFLDKGGSGTLANAIKSIDYARKMGAKIMNNSWGGRGASDLLKAAIEETNKEGGLFVVAAGNDATDNDALPSFPANYDVSNVLSVAAIDNRGALASFSNYGAKTVHVAAPGVNIISTVLDGKYDSYSGTSMATPHVAGIAALMLAHEDRLTNSDLKGRILASARPLATLRKQVASGGMADAHYALSRQVPPADPNDPANLSSSRPHVFSTDHPYKAGEKFEHRIQVPGAHRIAVRFSRFDTEISYDTVSFFDGNGNFVGALSGTQDPGVTSPLIEGDTVILKFSSDETVTNYGFDVDAVLFESPAFSAVPPT